ncbi:MAG: hypothetical protein WAT70_03750 [Rhizobiaceae bacterium]
MKEIACIRGVLGTDADDLDDDALKAVIADLNRRARERQRISDGMDAAEALNIEAAQLASDVEFAAKVEKRNAMINIVRRKEARAFVDSFADKAQGLEALLAGSNKRTAGARLSVDSRARAKEGRYLGGLINDLKRDGLLQFVQARLFATGKGPLDDKIAVELYELRDGGTPGRSGSPDAQKIAKIINKYQELARADQNRAGAFIRKMPGYIVAQSHDMFRIRAAGENEWIAKALPLLDADKTFDGSDPIQFLRGVYAELSQGAFYKADADAPLIGFKGPANLAKKASQSRVLHFKDAASWTAYNDAFGQGGIMEAATFGLRRAARNVALMETLGTNPKAMFDRLVTEYGQEAIDAGNAAALKDKVSRLNGMMAVADGSVDIPANVTAARIGAGIRAWNTMAKLGGAVISSLPDIATAAGELRYQGRGFLSGLGDQVASFFGAASSTSAKREIAERLGVGFDGMIGQVISRITAADSMPGTMSKLQTSFFRLNLLSWWTDAHEAGFSTIMARDLAMLSGKTFDVLPAERQRVLSLYNIGAAEWDLIRAHGGFDAEDGVRYIVPDVLDDAADDAFAGLVKGKATPAKIKAARADLDGKLRAYYADRTSFGVLKGGIREKFATTQGLQAGTTMGELARFFMQFKSYSVSFVNKTLGRFAEEDTFWKVPGGLARMPWGEKRQAAQMILAMTALGYMSMTMKDIAKGREPRDPADPRSWTQAFLQGGGAGIYGDFLSSDFNRFGGGGLETLAGPTAGMAGDALRLFGAAKDWVNGTAKAPDGQAFAIFKNNTPFLNLFYTRAALDYLILYDIQEAVSPGSLKRMEKRIKEETGQGFILPPSGR